MRENTHHGIWKLKYITFILVLHETFEHMRITIFLIFSIAFMGCESRSKKNNETHADSIIKDAYPVLPLHILTEEEDGGGADIRLSIVNIEKSDSFIIYKILSIYNQQQVGFEVDIPSKRELKIPLKLKSIGTASDNFLHVFSTLYQSKLDSTKRFTSYCKATFIDMNEFAKDHLGQTISGIEGLKEYKLFFESDKDEDYAELYLNVNEREHWIEVQEKDAGYRKPILRLLTQQ